MNARYQRPWSGWQHRGPPGGHSEGKQASRAEFRAWVRTCHPDVGGDPDTFAAGLARWRLALLPGPAEPGNKAAPVTAQVTVFRSRGGWWLIARAWHRRRRMPRVM